MASTRGSEWNRWDVHIHAPGTALEDRFPPNSTDEYIKLINEAQPPAIALGITDYLSLRAYAPIYKRWRRGELPGVKFLFPNIEFRISPPTDKFKGVNFHLLVDSSDPEHQTKIQSALGRITYKHKSQPYTCNDEGITSLGRAVDSKQTDSSGAYRAGVIAFKVHFSKFEEWYTNETWLRANSLVAVSNKEKDGVSGLPAHHGYRPEMDDMYRFADIIFSGNPSDRRYFLGLGPDKPADILRRCSSLKPCLHGCDAHKPDDVLRPDEERVCWIKAEPTFEGLRQVVFEPEGRVHIGPDRPARPRDLSIRSVHVTASWFPSRRIDLNEGLVSIIGPRGSGKTALADLIAHGTDSFEEGPASFLVKALPEARSTPVAIEWAPDGEKQTRNVGEPPDKLPGARYLSQHFVEQLCSGDRASERLIEEIENVIFGALDETDRSGASSFPELREIVTGGSDRRISELRAKVADFSDQIGREVALGGLLPKKKQELEKVEGDITRIVNSLKTLVVTGKEEKVQALQKLQEEASEMESDISSLKVKKRRLVEIQQDLELQQCQDEEDFETLKSELRDLGIPEEEHRLFRRQFGGDYKIAVGRRLGVLDQAIMRRTKGSDPPQDNERCLFGVRREIEVLEKEIGGDSLKERSHVALQTTLKEKRQERTRLQADIQRAEGAQGRIKTAKNSRLERYLQVFEEFDRQRTGLEELYAPLAANLANGHSERAKLEFFVRQRVDVDSWADRGEALLDLRRKSEFQERGSLALKVQELLGEPWETGEAKLIRKGMATLVELFRDAYRYLVKNVTLAQFADWLFSTDHIRLSYELRYEGTEIERLSPGTRGIVLLILYLDLDTSDDRPLIIDQPEENLDPQSIFRVLTKYFRESRRRRQVILVTHNPNLVVNTDSDQVIVANSERLSNAGLPRLSYQSGGLENPTIRDLVCEILEGGREAFLKRERRYAINQ